MSKVVGTFDELKELILIEEFKSCCTRELKLHLEELKLASLQENAIAADEYVLSHRNLLNQNRWRNQKEYVKGSNPKGDDSKKDNKDDNKPGDESSNQGKNRGSPRGSPTRYGKNRGSPRGSPTRYGKKLNCYYCKKPGYVRANCFAFK